MIYAGIDLGGTFIKTGIVAPDGKILGESSMPTGVGRSFEDIAHDMVLGVMEALKKADKDQNELAAIGVGIPGIADQNTGRIVFCPNLDWRDVPLKEEIQKYLDLPVFIDNDATVAGLAEAFSGVSRSCSSSVFITLGTGVGAGIILNGKPWSGAHGVGSELGHMTLLADGVPCTCGNNGCVERYCSATALARMGRQAAMAYPDSRINSIAGSVDNIDARAVIDAAREGDRVASRVFDRYATYLAMTINNITAFLDPEMVVLGGGVSHAGSFLLEAVRGQLPRFLLYKSLPSPKVELAQLGNEAGMIGAAALARVHTAG